jgi:hypothetical protein
VDEWVTRWLASIHVSGHAQSQARDRCGFGDADAIRQEVRLALLEGRYSEVKPNWAAVTDYHAARRRPDGVYAWDADALRCWVLAWGGVSVHVLTVLVDRDEQAAVAGRRHLRVGAR